MAVILVAAGLAVLIGGAEVLVRGGVRLAAHFGVSSLVIGLTLVSIGTSAPELAIGIDSAVQGVGSLTVGNIAGTNTVNILLVLGISAAMRAIVVETTTLRVTLPAIVLAATALTAMSWKGHLSRTDGMVLVAGAVLYTVLVVRQARRESVTTRREFAQEFSEPAGPHLRWEPLKHLALLVGGIVAVVLGSIWLVDGATRLALVLGVSEGFIGLTIVAIGTSAPELVTSVVGTLRDERDIAVGNLLGSSAYNILFILGITALIPAGGIHFERTLVHVDIPVMTASAIALAPLLLTGRRISRTEGVGMVAAYVGYLGYLLVART